MLYYRFIKNRITEKRFLQTLANNERKMEKYAIYHDLLDIMGNQGEQIVFKYYDNEGLSLNNMIKEFEELYWYVDNAFEKPNLRVIVLPFFNLNVATSLLLSFLLFLLSKIMSSCILSFLNIIKYC